MCGIVGVISKNFNIEATLKKAHEVQSHRGPDNHSEMIVEENGWKVGLAHQRLSIIDLAAASNQPMFYKNKGAIIFNGELYNYLEIRKELEKEGIVFQTDSDTEVLLVSLHYYGIEEALKKFNGMWAFAWYDIENRKIYLCRDRIGIKPLQYYIEDNTLFFSSEIKTILEIVGKRFDLNEQKVGEYLAQSLLVTDEETFFKGIYRLPAGCYAEIDLQSQQLDMKIKSYWSLNADETTVEKSEEELAREIKELFIDAVRIQLRSDVPIGVLLSGGIDSSAITAVMHELLGSKTNINIFSAVSNDKRFDESFFIDSVANHLKRPVHKVTLDFGPEEAMELLDIVNWYNDEPVGSFSNVAHYLLMKKARELGVTVILSGQGADELLCGYKKYVGFYIQQLIKQGKFLKATAVFAEFKKRGTVINQFSFQEAKRYIPEKFRPKEINILGQRVIEKYRPVSVGLGKIKDVRNRQILDIQRFSVPVLTHYEDRMSMAFSREIRVPFLDHRLVEKLVSLPIENKLNRGWTKYIFRKSMESLLPREVVWRKDKQGFVNPQSEWLKNELKEKVQDYFSNESLMVQLGLINYEALNKKFIAYCSQPVNKGTIWFKEIFNPLALESWLRQYRKYINFCR